MRYFFPQLREWLHRLRGQTIEFNLRPYERIAANIQDRCDELIGKPDGVLRESAKRIRENVQRGGLASQSPKSRRMRFLRRAALADIATFDQTVECFALTCEASRRVLGLTPYPTQIIAGLVLNEGKLSQMQTGEGKTLAAVAPASLHGLAGKGAHILTFNDYLAKRDAQWMGPIYEFLDLSVGFVQQGMSRQERQAAYQADVTYVTAKEAGFDYLRDGLRRDARDLVHRPFHFAIVDEADSILIDEARVPLVVAGGQIPSEDDLRKAADLVKDLDPRTDYDTDEYARNVFFTNAGLNKLERRLGCGDLHREENVRWLTRLNLALHAHVLLTRDVDYLVRDDKIQLIDEFTGRVAENRRWPYGLQEALEAKEGVTIQSQGEILGSITLQHFLRLYPRVAGMTATATAAAEEFETFYDMTVVVIPSFKPCVRNDFPDQIYAHQEAKHQAIIAEIEQAKQKGQPVLVGTASVDESEKLSAALLAKGIGCEVLNAQRDEAEAKIIAQAGALGAVTISTNMAGRGVDIRLGGADGQQRERVAAVGGLYVIGAARYESRRIDDQLRGRAGRQGDPGVSRFLISIEDDLLKRYQLKDLLGGRVPDQMEEKQEPIDDPFVFEKIAHVQRIIEGESFEIRKTLRRYSEKIEEQRKTMRSWRDEVLFTDAGATLLHSAPATTKRYTEIVEQFGSETASEAARQIALHHIDRRWAEHLAHVAEIRDGIHLFSYGGFSPLDEFHKAVNTAFRDLRERIEQDIIQTFLSVERTDSGLNLEQAGLLGPSSTWTYLINDAPLGDAIERVARHVKKWLTRNREMHR